MSVMNVTPEEIRNAAGRIEGYVGEYDSAVQEFYKQVDGLQGSLYSGEAADAFKKKVEEFRDDFTKMSQRMTAYATYLRNTADDHTNTEANVKALFEALRS